MAATHARKSTLVASLALVAGILLAALMGPAATTAGAQTATASASGCKAKSSRSSKAVSRSTRVRRQRRCSTSPTTQPTGGSTQPTGSTATGSAGGTGGTGSTPPPPPPPAGTLLRHDPATNPDPDPLWNEIAAQSSSRHQQYSSGGPDGGAFRRMSVQDGDDFWGERAELGYNSRLNGLGAPWGTFFLYNAGDRRVTEFWMRLPTSFPINTNKWQVVMQMKQTGPHANNGGTPVLALEAREGRWVLTQSDSPGYAPATHEVWSTPATLGQWAHIRLDVTYSPDPSLGKVQLGVNGVNSPTFTTFTQKYEMAPGSEGLNPGDPIPSHLRMGIYHDTSLPGTHVDLADVKVFS
jgi:hypothetical protein